MDPRYHFSRCIARMLPDKLYLSIKFRSHMGYWMDWNNPQTFSEKLQWLKIYDRHPEYTKLVDKAAVKDYVASIIGQQYIIPTLAVYDSAEEIDFDVLPNQFVLKCTHDSGGIIICRDMTKLDKAAAIKKLKKGLKRTYVIQNREYPYKNVPRRIIAEKYINGDNESDLKDYKFFCFNGRVECCQVISNRSSKMTVDFYDKAWNHQPFHEPKNFQFSNFPIQRPDNYSEMLYLAEVLSKNYTFIRVDLYNVRGRIYFGELTFFPTTGMGGFDPQEWDLIFGQMIKLPIIK